MVPRTTAIVVGGISSIVFLLIGLAISPGSGSSSTASSSPTSHSSFSAGSSSSSEPTTTRAPLPLASDFTVKVDVTSQNCFGSAGCNYELNVEPEYVGNGSLASDVKATVIYEIIGGDDPMTANFHLADGKIRWQEEKSLSASADTTFTTKIDKVIPDY